MKKIFLLTLMICFFVGCSNDKQKDKDENTSVNIEANLEQGEDVNFDIHLIDGNSISVQKSNEKITFDTDKATLFVFFTTWCTPCVAEIPYLNNLQNKYKDQINIVGVLLEDKSDEDIKAFKDKNKIVYEIANGENNYLLAKSLGGVNGIPTMFLYDKYSKLINEYLGLIPQEMLEIDIQKAVF
ncbi:MULTISPECIES: TlpA family protein disulfide reductase [Campylobacter]|uniref:TlpA family protein disulfide reductase n=1 Tax=Campylobacter taeniopygiae TaxID=2510188 RepID=A0ABY2TIV1_9BACT|nr:TlpA disulfide reductase family protein [Campylobacter taeniopygiae]MBZ7963924.1 TlpA family protein disulfide reductase [Campylobacter sp. 2457A]TKX33922.1 TlpA family protein disulfide reductase [Campylobacter taeniopygiae]